MQKIIETKKPIAFQGEHGAFSEIAIFKIFGNSGTPQPTKSFNEVFEKVKSGVCEYGVLPVENTLGGIVYQVWDCLNEYNLRIVAETRIKIDHCLIVNPGTSIADIKKIYTHYQPKLQCAHFLDDHKNWIIEDAYDTAGSVEIIKNIEGKQKKTVAAIASDKAAEIFGMEILKKGIQDSQQNFTRFVVISKNNTEESKGNKFTYVLSIENIPGALLELLKILKKYKINLTSIHSRPDKSKPFAYNFFIEGILKNKTFSTIRSKFVSEIKSKSIKSKLLGIYYSELQ